MKLNVRDAVEDDFRLVAERMLDEDDYVKQPAFCSWCRNPKCNLLVAESGDDGVVGLVLLQLDAVSRLQAQLQECAYIGALRVSREHRRRKIGVRLITAAYQLAREVSLGSIIKMKVSPQNEKMKLLLRKHVNSWEGLMVFDSTTGLHLDLSTIDETKRSNVHSADGRCKRKSNQKARDLAKKQKQQK